MGNIKQRENVKSVVQDTRTKVEGFLEGDDINQQIATSCVAALERLVNPHENPDEARKREDKPVNLS